MASFLRADLLPALPLKDSLQEESEFAQARPPAASLKRECLGTHHHHQRAEELSRQELMASDAFLTTLSAGAPREQ